MKKICYVVTLGQTIKAFFIDQLEYLADNGYDVTVVCDDNYNLKEWLSSRIHLIDIKIPRGISFLRSFKAFNQLKKVFKKEAFDLVQYSTPNAAFLASLASKSLKVPIRNYHLMGLKFEGYEGFLKKILMGFEKCACRCSTHIECVSTGTLEKGVKYGLFHKEKATVVGAGSTGGVNTKKFDSKNKPLWRKEIREKYSISEEDKVFGFAGRIAKDKGILELISAFDQIPKSQISIPSSSLRDATPQSTSPRVPEKSSRLFGIWVRGTDFSGTLGSDLVQKKIPCIKLMLVGPVEDSFLIEEIRNINNIILVPKVDDIERYYAAMDVVVLPSYREGFGNLLIEAETMGVPCIASDIDGPRDAMKNNETGFLVPPRDISALATAMENILKEETYLKFSQNAIEYAKLFDSNVLCQNILDRKNKLLKE